LTRPFTSLAEGLYAAEWAAVVRRVAVVCGSCGSRTGDYPGAHAPHLSNDVPPRMIDCAGRPCVLGADGYWCST
jgi:hypothetical protein